ncbi:MAG: tyrosine-type recombinase/integrase [Acetobacteraceae bacterium]
MPLHLVAPGKRTKYRQGKPYPNRFFIVRGKIAGRTIEVSTFTRDPTEAAAYKARVELDFLENRVPEPGEAVTFAKALELYLAYKTPTEADANRIRHLSSVLGQKRVASIRHADIVAATDVLYPGKSNETKNRWVVKPAAAILHYASKNEWCDWTRISKLKERPVRTRAADDHTAQMLLQTLAGEATQAKTAREARAARKKWLLILWLFRHYNRISDPLRLTWENIDLDKGTYSLLVSKTGQWREKPLSDEVLVALANEPDQSGYVFPWRTRSGVYRWLRPLVRRLGLRFTPHMARHFGGKKLNAAGQGLKTIMGALDHADPHSSMRYQDADLEIVRAGINSVGKLVGK